LKEGKGKRDTQATRKERKDRNLQGGKRGGEKKGKKKKKKKKGEGRKKEGQAIRIHIIASGEGRVEIRSVHIKVKKEVRGGGEGLKFFLGKEKKSIRSPSAKREEKGEKKCNNLNHEVANPLQQKKRRKDKGKDNPTGREEKRHLQRYWRANKGKTRTRKKRFPSKKGGGRWGNTRRKANPYTREGQTRTVTCSTKRRKGEEG